jgi:hypothetical protein
VSMGTLEGSVSTMKQSSMSGSVALSVNGVVTWTLVPSRLNVSTVPRGMPVESMGRYLSVQSSAMVPAIVGSPERLK